MAQRDPFGDLEPLVRRVYGYVSYRIGSGPDSEDLTSECFERALRYRSSYNAERGPPAAWLIGIARRCVDDWLGARREGAPAGEIDGVDRGDVEEVVLGRLTLERALLRLPERDRELVALRYGADLSARRIAELMGSTVNATEVALHRAVARLRGELERQEAS